MTIQEVTPIVILAFEKSIGYPQPLSLSYDFRHDPANDYINCQFLQMALEGSFNPYIIISDEDFGKLNTIQDCINYISQLKNLNEGTKDH